VSSAMERGRRKSYWVAGILRALSCVKQQEEEQVKHQDPRRGPAPRPQAEIRPHPAHLVPIGEAAVNPWAQNVALPIGHF
jgi:hypothetical protein